MVRGWLDQMFLGVFCNLDSMIPKSNFNARTLLMLSLNSPSRISCERSSYCRNTKTKELIWILIQNAGLRVKALLSYRESLKEKREKHETTCKTAM